MHVGFTTCSCRDLYASQFRQRIAKYSEFPMGRASTILSAHNSEKLHTFSKRVSKGEMNPKSTNATVS